MKNLITVLLAFLTFGLFAQHGIVKESLQMKSSLLGKEVPYTIYLPYDYETSQRTYPVLYLLHGYGDSQIGWLHYGDFNFYADETINSNKTTPMIIVTPHGGNSWYVNSYDGKQPWEDFFTKEFIPYIEANYRALPQRSARAIAGNSMGGSGAIILALKHPELFRACTPMSPAFRTNEEIVALSQAEWDDWYGLPYGVGLKGKARLSQHYQNNSVVSLVNQMRGRGDDYWNYINDMKFYIDVGDDDSLSKVCGWLHDTFFDWNIPHQYRVGDGGHDYIFWSAGLPGLLEFVGHQGFQ